MTEALLAHWPEYAIEGALLGLFMVSACLFVVLLEHVGSPLRRRLSSPLMRRALIGLAMGVTAVLLIRSPWGRTSGAHMNPAVTLAFWTLGKVEGVDAFFYVMSQCLGGIGGVLLSRLVLGRGVAHPSVHFAATVPGDRGPLLAWLAEFGISFLMLTVVLIASNTRSLAAYTPFFAGALLVLYITFEAPLSGMSLNPARTLGSAVPARDFRGFWIYCTAPVLAMLISAAGFAAIAGKEHVLCAKLCHGSKERCIFHCRFHEARNPAETSLR